MEHIQTCDREKLGDMISGIRTSGIFCDADRSALQTMEELFDALTARRIPSESTWPARTISALNRLLTILGYKTEADREKALARFLAWLTFVEAYVGSQDSEVRATWTEAALRALGNVNRLTTTSAAEEAASLADGLIAQQLRRFPPRPHEPLDNMVDVVRNISEVQVIADLSRERDEALAKLAERDADLLKYATEIDDLRKQVAERDGAIARMVCNISPGVDGTEVDQQGEVRRAEDALSDMKNLLAKTAGVDPSLSLDFLVSTVVDMVAGRTRAAETLAEREASRLRADLQSTLRELATVREERDAAIKCGQRAQEREARVVELSERERDAAVKAKEKAEQELAELSAKALIPQPKPGTVWVGQKWAKIVTVDETTDSGDVMANGIAHPPVSRKVAMLRSENWIYLG